ncbi:MAG: hypothetical protein U0457_04880 [Candidatus Sericytochromatia bacterium]
MASKVNAAADATTVTAQLAAKQATEFSQKLKDNSNTQNTLGVNQALNLNKPVGDNKDFKGGLDKLKESGGLSLNTIGSDIGEKALGALNSAVNSLGLGSLFKPAAEQPAQQPNKTTDTKEAKQELKTQDSGATFVPKDDDLATKQTKKGVEIQVGESQGSRAKQDKDLRDATSRVDTLAADTKNNLASIQKYLQANADLA